LDKLYNIPIDKWNTSLLKYIKKTYKSRKPDKVKTKENALRDPVFREITFRDGDTVTFIAYLSKGKPSWKIVSAIFENNKGGISKMNKLIKALCDNGRKDLAEKVKAKIRLFQTPLNQKNALVENLKEKALSLSPAAIENMVTDLLTMTRRSFNATVAFLVGKYRLSYPEAEMVTNTVSRSEDLTEGLR